MKTINEEDKPEDKPEDKAEKQQSLDELLASIEGLIEKPEGAEPKTEPKKAEPTETDDAFAQLVASIPSGVAPETKPVQPEAAPEEEEPEEKPDEIAAKIVDTDTTTTQTNRNIEGRRFGGFGETVDVLPTRLTLTPEDLKTGGKRTEELQKLLQSKGITLDKMSEINWKEWSNEEIAEYNRLVTYIKYDKTSTWSSDKMYNEKIDTFAMKQVPIDLWPEINADAKGYRTVRSVVKLLLHGIDDKNPGAKASTDPFAWYKNLYAQSRAEGGIESTPLDELQMVFSKTIDYYNTNSDKQTKLDYLRFLEAYYEHNTATRVFGPLIGQDLVLVGVPGQGYTVMPLEMPNRPLSSFKGIQRAWPRILTRNKRIWAMIPDTIRVGDKIIAKDYKTVSAQDVWSSIDLRKIIADYNAMYGSKYGMVNDDVESPLYGKEVKNAIMWAKNPVQPKSEEFPLTLVSDYHGPIVARLKARLSFTPKAGKRQEYKDSKMRVVGGLNNAIVNLFDSINYKKGNINHKAVANLKVPIDFYKRVAGISEANPSGTKTYLPDWDDNDLMMLERLFKSALPSAKDVYNNPEAAGIERSINDLRSELGYQNAEAKQEIEAKINELKDKAVADFPSPNLEEWERNFAQGEAYPHKVASPSKGSDSFEKVKSHSQEPYKQYLYIDPAGKKMLSDVKDDSYEAKGFEYVGEVGHKVSLGTSGELENIEAEINKAIQKLNPEAAVKTESKKPVKVESLTMSGMVTTPTTIVVNNSAFNLRYGDRLIIDSVKN